MYVCMYIYVYIYLFIIVVVRVISIVSMHVCTDTLCVCVSACLPVSGLSACMYVTMVVTVLLWFTMLRHVRLCVGMVWYVLSCIE